MWVSQPGRDADLTQEALDAEARGELGMENLDGNRSVVFQICGQEDRRHPTAADRAVYRVAVREAGLQTSEETGQTVLADGGRLHHRSRGTAGPGPPRTLRHG